MSPFYRCRCYLTSNIFLKGYKVHVNFLSKEQFLGDYGGVLRDAGCDSQDKVDDVLQEIAKELERRRNVDAETKRRTELVAERYEPLHPGVYELSESFFEDAFLRLVDLCKTPGIGLDDVAKLFTKTHPNERIYTLPVFKPRFCRQLLEEVVHFESSDVPKGRPNTMNNYGILLGEMGFDDGFLTPFRERFLQPIASVLFPDWGGARLDSHRAFVVTYKPHEDKDLAFHYDNAEVTVNVCLGHEFSGGELYFGRMWDEPEDSTYKVFHHEITHGIFHRSRQRHGAMPVEEGNRYNFIMWMRSSDVRNELCPMCGNTPDPIPSLGFDDGFTVDESKHGEKEAGRINICVTLCTLKEY